jgi:hypothetical protein
VEGDIGDSAGLGRGQVGAAGIAAIGGGLPRRPAGAGDVAIEHGQESLGIGGVAGLDDDIEDQAALAGGQVELVSILNLTAALRMMSACGSNRLTSFSLAGTASLLRTRRSLWAMMRAISGK